MGKKTLFLHLAVLHNVHGELEQGVEGRRGSRNGRTGLFGFAINLNRMKRQ
jgi:hypothetical protein